MSDADSLRSATPREQVREPIGRTRVERLPDGHTYREKPGAAGPRHREGLSKAECGRPQTNLRRRIRWRLTAKRLSRMNAERGEDRRSRRNEWVPCLDSRRRPLALEYDGDAEVR
jgi:hypothetical protein